MTVSLAELGTPTGTRRTTPYPVDMARLPGVEISARYHSDRCRGDFFDGQTVGTRLVFLLTDIAGPRPEAHAIAIDVQETFRQRAWELFHAPEANEPDAIATLAHDVNRALMDAANGVRFSPTFLACFNADLGILTYCNAGQVLALFRDARSAQTLDRGGVPLGLFTHVTYEPAVLAFEPEDKLIVVSKGVTENRRGTARFGTRRIERLVPHANRDSAARICETVLEEAYQFGHNPWSRAYNFVLPRKQRAPEDMTAVTLIRR
jgi:serine phosphatase RsbU (regulator of sigma subunit)